MISDFDTLKADLASQIARSDVTSDSSTLETDIGLAETLLSRKLDLIRMEKEQAITTVEDSPSVDLNGDFLMVRNLEFDTDPQNIQYIPLNRFKTLYKYQGNQRPDFYTLIYNSDTDRVAIKFSPTPNDAYALTLTYKSKIPALGDSNTTNWLIDYDPELYLNAALYFSFRRYRNPIASDYLNLVEQRIKEINDEEQLNKLGQSGTKVRLRSNVV